MSSPRTRGSGETSATPPGRGPGAGRPPGADGDVVHERLCSHLLRTLCPVTGQPDWGSVLIDRFLYVDCAGKR